MASNYKETRKVSVKGFLNLEEGKIEIEDAEPVAVEEILQKFNGCEISLAIQLTNELDK